METNNGGGNGGIISTGYAKVITTDGKEVLVKTYQELNVGSTKNN